MPKVIAGPDMAGKTCPCCQAPIKPKMHVHVCDACGIPHHDECWQRNEGCSTFGCRRAGIASVPVGAGRAVSSSAQEWLPYSPPVYDGYQPSMQPGAYYGPAQAGYPGQYVADVPPEVIGKLNVGAFLLPISWSIAHNVWIGLLVLIPCLGWMIMPIVLLFKGSELAWKNRRFESVEHFNAVQHQWTIWGIVIWGIIVKIGVIVIIVGVLVAFHLCNVMYRSRP